MPEEPNTPDGSRKVLEKAQRTIKDLRFDAIKVYLVKEEVNYFNRTDASNIRMRSDAVWIQSRDTHFSDVHRSISGVTLTAVAEDAQIDICLALFRRGKEVNAVYINRSWPRLQIGKTFFKVPENDPLFASMNRFIAAKFHRE